MRHVRASPPPVPEDARRRAANRAHAEAQKKKKDTRAAKRDKKILEREALEKRRRRQKQDGLPVELSPSPSPSEDSSDEDGGIKGGGEVPWTISLMLGRQCPGRRRAARCFQGEEEVAPRDRRSLTLRPRLIHPSYGHWGSVSLAHWA